MPEKIKKENSLILNHYSTPYCSTYSSDSFKHLKTLKNNLKIFILDSFLITILIESGLLGFAHYKQTTPAL